MAREESGRGGGRHCAGRADDGAREGGHDHLRAGDAAGGDPGVGGDAVYLGQGEQGGAVAEFYVGGAHLG